jgi:4-carboxymuconolactone decarboxylase
MSRMPPLAEEAMTDPQRKRFHELWQLRGERPGGPGSFWIRSPAISEAAEPMRQQMERKAGVPKALSELAMLVAARHWSTPFAWGRHEPQAIKAGIDPAAVSAIRAGRPPQFDDERAGLVHDMSWELLRTGGLSDALYARAASAFTEPQLVEMVSEIGYACLVALANATFAPDPPPGIVDDLEKGPAPVAPKAVPSRPTRLPAPAWSHCPAIAACAQRYEDALGAQLSMDAEMRRLITSLVADFWNGRANPPDNLAASFVLEILSQGGPSEATFAQAVERFGLVVVTELTAIVGYVTMRTLTANVFGRAL